MSCGVTHIDFVLAVALVLGVWSRSCTLHYLKRSPLEVTIVVGIGHGEFSDSWMPTDTSPAKINVVRVVAQNERRRICGVVLHVEHLFLT